MHTKCRQPCLKLHQWRYWQQQAMPGLCLAFVNWEKSRKPSKFCRGLVCLIMTINTPQKNALCTLIRGFIKWHFLVSCKTFKSCIKEVLPQGPVPHQQLGTFTTRDNDTPEPVGLTVNAEVINMYQHTTKQTTVGGQHSLTEYKHILSSY